MYILGMMVKSITNICITAIFCSIIICTFAAERNLWIEQRTKFNIYDNKWAKTIDKCDLEFGWHQWQASPKLCQFQYVRLDLVCLNSSECSSPQSSKNALNVYKDISLFFIVLKPIDPWAPICMQCVLAFSNRTINFSCAPLILHNCHFACILTILAYLLWLSNSVIFTSTNQEDNLEDALASCWPSKKYAIIVHGFRESCNTPWASTLRESKASRILLKHCNEPFHSKWHPNRHRFDRSSWRMHHLHGL